MVIKHLTLPDEKKERRKTGSSDSQKDVFHTYSVRAGGLLIIILSLLLLHFILLLQ